jgi:hypothetical protein
VLSSGIWTSLLHIKHLNRDRIVGIFTKTLYQGTRLDIVKDTYPGYGRLQNLTAVLVIVIYLTIRVGVVGSG